MNLRCTHVYLNESCIYDSYNKTASGGAEENSYEEMTMAEIMMGKKGTIDETHLFK